jgi:hypothetical protein
MPAPTPKGDGQVALLGAKPTRVPPVVVEAPQPVGPSGPSPLADLKLGGSTIDERLQTIFIEDPKVDINEQELRDIAFRVLLLNAPNALGSPQKMVRIVVPGKSHAEEQLTRLAETINKQLPGLFVSKHEIPTRKGALQRTAFLVMPHIRVNVNGWGTEGIKVFQALLVLGFDVAVTVNSLRSPARVLDAFHRDEHPGKILAKAVKEGVDVYLTSRPLDRVQQFKDELLAYLTDSLRAAKKNELLEHVPESQRADSAKMDPLLDEAEEFARKSAEEMLNARFKGLISEALMVIADKLFQTDNLNVPIVNINERFFHFLETHFFSPEIA